MDVAARLDRIRDRYRAEINVRALPGGKGWFGNMISRLHDKPKLYNWTLTCDGLRWRRLS